jgi:hypothetical protein
VRAEVAARAVLAFGQMVTQARADSDFLIGQAVHDDAADGGVEAIEIADSVEGDTGIEAIVAVVRGDLEVAPVARSPIVRVVVKESSEGRVGDCAVEAALAEELDLLSDAE